MSDAAVDEGGALGEAERSEWTISLNLAGWPGAAGSPLATRAIDGLHLTPGEYWVTLEDTPSGASGYRNAASRKWSNTIFAIVSTGEEIGRQTLGENCNFPERREAQKDFNGPDKKGRPFFVLRVSNVFFHPILGARGNEGELKLRIRRVREIAPTNCQPFP
ncbi:MAG: hypothetical protein ACKO01_05855 [Erythrobacter sp.]